MIHAKDMKKISKERKKVEEKQENLLAKYHAGKAKYYGNRIWRDMSSLEKWLILAVVTGCIVGAASSLFSYVLKTVTNVRRAILWIFYLLPVSGLIIVFCIRNSEKMTEVRIRCL